MQHLEAMTRWQKYAFSAESLPQPCPTALDAQLGLLVDHSCGFVVPDLDFDQVSD